MGRRVDSNPKTQILWTIVIVRDDFNIEDFNRARAWCEEHLAGRWSYGRERRTGDKPEFAAWRNTFRFKDRKEAMLFKLTFGGEA